MGTEIKSISVSREFADLAREHNIGWSEAARVGMGLMLSERGLVEYDNKLNLVRKMQKFKEIAEKASQELDLLKVKNGN